MTGGTSLSVGEWRSSYNTGAWCDAGRSRAGVINRGEISPMGEILGIQGGNESV